MAVFALISVLMIYESHVESVRFSRKENYMYMRRYRLISCWTKVTCLKLSNIVRVHAAKTGYVGKDVDQSCFCLVITYRNPTSKKEGDVKIKILETKRH